MRRLVIMLSVLGSLAATATASAGCWATVGLSPLPDGVAAGETWIANVQVLQHGRTPLAEATPKVILTSVATGETREFAAAAARPTEGRYRARVVFPAAGRWSVAVHDGFPWKECAQTHTFGAFAIGAAAQPPAPPAAERAAAPAESDEDGSFPVLAVALGVGLGLGLLVIAGVGARLRGASHP